MKRTVHDDRVMRTTLDIDDDVLQAVKALAAARRETAGQVISALARQAPQPSRASRTRNGVPVLPRRPAGAPRPTMKQVNELRDEGGGRRDLLEVIGPAAE